MKKMTEYPVGVKFYRKLCLMDKEPMNKTEFLVEFKNVTYTVTVELGDKLNADYLELKKKGL